MAKEVGVGVEIWTHDPFVDPEAAPEKPSAWLAGQRPLSPVNFVEVERPPPPAEPRAAALH